MKLPETGEDYSTLGQGGGGLPEEGGHGGGGPDPKHCPAHRWAAGKVHRCEAEAGASPSRTNRCLGGRG